MIDDIQGLLAAINWPTLIAVMVVFVPVATGLFKLIVGRAREDLAAEREAHARTRDEKQALAEEWQDVLAQNAELTARLGHRRDKERWREVELTEEEQTVLIAVSKDEMNYLYHARRISAQRISMAKDHLHELGFIGYGVEGAYTTPTGRKWLEANGLLD